MDTLIKVTLVTSNMKPRSEMPNKRPLSDFSAAHVNDCRLKLVCPGIVTWLYHLLESRISMSPSSRPTANLQEKGSPARVLIGAGCQFAKRNRWTQ